VVIVAMLLLLACLELVYVTSSGVIYLNRAASTTIINEELFIVLYCENTCKQKCIGNDNGDHITKAKCKMCLGKCLKSTHFHHHRSCNGDSDPIRSINVTNFKKTNLTDISAIVTVSLSKETVADYVLFIEYRTQANRNRWTLLEVVLGESVFEVHNLNMNISYQLRVSYSIAWEAPCGKSALSDWINLTRIQE
uniref:Fibronectin type-III domain-containing protein n=2 Tax=Parascaris univalens TaxID=6257 RepID=A0A915C823_PARUN